MALSEKQWQWIAEGIQLAVAAVLAAVRTAGEDGPLDWSSLRITQTPEMALEAAKQKARESEARIQKKESEPRPSASGPLADRESERNE